MNTTELNITTHHAEVLALAIKAIQEKDFDIDVDSSGVHSSMHI